MPSPVLWSMPCTIMMHHHDAPWTIHNGPRVAGRPQVLSHGECLDCRDALAKALYASAFSWVVAAINRKLDSGACACVAGGLGARSHTHTRMPCGLWQPSAMLQSKAPPAHACSLPRPVLHAGPSPTCCRPCPGVACSCPWAHPRRPAPPPLWPWPVHIHPRHLWLRGLPHQQL